jgi:NADP-dependent 3-hydroxy acid dehydrogenase YdfG
VRMLTSSRIQATAEAIRKDVPDAQLTELVLDLSSQQAVRKAAAEVLAYPEPVDVVITNAGVVRIALTF